MSTNVLIATSTVKLLSGITSTANDALIEYMVPIVLSDIVSYCKNSFTNSTMYKWGDKVSFSSTGQTVTSGDTNVVFTDYWVTGSVILFDGSIHNDGYFSVAAVSSSFVTLNESVIQESSANGKFVVAMKVEYPKDLQMIAARMITHLINTQTRSDVASEGIGDYSVSYIQAGSNAYPPSIIGSLNKYRKVGFR